MVTYVDAASAPLKNDGTIRLYDAASFERMRQICQITAACLDGLAEIIRPGITTEAIDRFVLEFGLERGVVPATLGYRGYKFSSCTSINHVVCHGMPNSKPLKEGDIINVDVTYVLDGWHGDSSRMYPVGEIKRAAERLMEVTYESLLRGIAAVKPGARTGAIGEAIQTYAESERCSVVRDFCGHGVGRLFHDTPNILHYGHANEGPVLKEGMIFTIEPMLNIGKPHVKVLNDGWTAVTRDRSLSAQYEHCVGVTKDGCEVFTLSPGGHDRPGLPDINA
nr:type I methionyl aminopeptidase [Marinicella sp. W31]MDC2876978.1 type I methionyl aminopeptidase [Marinicella sp. W31]